MIPSLIAITDPALPTPDTWLDAAITTITAGVPWLHLRAKTLPYSTRLHAAQVLAEKCHQHGTRLIINTDIEIARAVDAHALHLPRNVPRPNTSEFLLTRACHSLDDILIAHKEGINAVTLSPIFAPSSKPEDTRATLGLNGLATACTSSPLPIIALGGITPQNARACRHAGAAGVAAIGAFFALTNEEKHTKLMIETWTRTEV